MASNTVTDNLPSGGTIATSMNHYQHPERVAVVSAILLPLLNEAFRLWKRRAPKQGAS